MSKTASVIIVALLCLLFFPVVIGIVGGVFGAVFGVIGGLFGAVFGILGGVLGAIFGFIGWIFEGIFDWGWDGPFHTDWNFFTVLIIVIVIALIAKKAQGDTPSKQ
jgi:MFS family permease